MELKRFRGTQRILAHHIYHKVRFLVFLVILLFLVGTIAYTVTKNIPLQDSFVLTLETLAFANAHQVDAGPRFTQVFLQLFGVLVFWFVAWTLADLMLEGEIDDWITEVKIIMGEHSMKDHYIICGAGRVGIHVAELLEERGDKFVILERSHDLAKRLKKHKWLVIHGDVLDEELLKEAGIQRAKAIIGAIPETEKNVMLALVAKQLNPAITIYARAEKEEFIKQLKTAGAKYVIMPEVVGAEQIVASIEKETGK